MKCPICTEVDLVMADRSGVEIDYCPKCRGVWLDRGELDKIIERSTESLQGPPPSANYGPGHFPGKDDSHYGHPYKKKSWLRELFD
jgi:uncharacterized protein